MCVCAAGDATVVYSRGFRDYVGRVKAGVSKSIPYYGGQGALKYVGYAEGSFFNLCMQRRFRSVQPFLLADRTIGRAYGTVCRLSVCRLSVVCL